MKIANISAIISYDKSEPTLLGLPLELREKIYKNLFKLERGTRDSKAITLKPIIGPGNYGEAKSCEALGLSRPDDTKHAKDNEHHECVADLLSMRSVCKRFYVEFKQRALMCKWNTFMLYSNAPNLIGSLVPARDRHAVERVH